MKNKVSTAESRAASKNAAQRKYYLKNKEKIAAYQKEYAKKNKSKRAENLRRWRSENKERFLATTREWMEKNPDSQKKKSKKYWEKNKERLKSEHRAWVKNNPHLSNASNGRRRINVKFHVSSNHALISAVYKETHRLSKSHGFKFCTDHIIPVIRGGFHHEENLQPLPKHLNDSKHDDPFWISPMGYRDWRDVPRELWPVELRYKYLALIEQNKGKSIRWDTAA